MLGKHHSDTTKKKISKANKGKESKLKKQVICIELNKEFSSLAEAKIWCKENNIKADIASYVTGRQKYAGKLADGTKLHWRYI